METTSATALARLVAALVFISPLAPQARADAPAFRGDPAHSGTYASDKLPGLDRLAWKFKTGGKVVSSPAVSRGIVYVGSADRVVYALGAADGAVRWQYKTAGAVNSSPAVAADTVFVASADGNLYALGASDGKLRWKFASAGERRFTAPGIHGATPRTELMPDPFDVFLSSPTVVAGIVYFGSGDHYVYAVDADSGALRWKFETGNVVHASPAVADGVVYIGSWDRNLYALNASTGALLWKFQTGDDKEIYNQVGIASSAAVAGGTVFFGCRDGHFYAVDAKSGARKWAHDNKKGWVIASPAIDRGVVYFATSDGERFKALDAETGATIYDISNKAVSFSSPAVASGTVFYGSSDGWLHAVDAATGRVKAEFQTDGSKANAARYIDRDGRIDNAALYPEFTLDGMIIGLDRMFSLGSVLSSPVVVDGVVYFGSTDGNVYAIQ
ncbi:MAG TPA: PQQ-binding-like beta-propeller repeat protein [Casimicrobiaceae bacterium]|jgi:outer membrane protein assembly factor BamB|nr:PQQ-binding-like beta-propeller repeat protein [Casimicrobiaceae bacterium]